MDRYRDREQAGEVLAAELGHYRGLTPLVLAVPRGGVPVAAKVVAAVGGDLDLVVARKLGAPHNPELAIGAVAADGEPLVDRPLADRLGVDDPYIAAEAARQTEEVRRREAAYRGDRPPPEVAGRVVIVVDDGVATGATLRAALDHVRRRRPQRLCCAVPVGPPDTIRALARHADEVVCPLQPRWFLAVGEWYRDFDQTDDAEVVALLEVSPGPGQLG